MFKIVRILFVLALAAGFSAPRAQAFMDTEAAWNDLLQWGLSKVNTPGQFEIKLGHVSSPFDGKVELNDFSISDGRGPWLTAEKVIMEWSPSSLLLGDIEIDDVEIIKPQLLRSPDPGKPEQDNAAIDDPSSDPPLIGWPRLPVNFGIKHYTATDGFIAPGILAQSFKFDASGALKDWGDEQSFALDLKRQDRPGDKLLISFLHLFETDSLALSLTAHEDSDGLVGASIGLPDPQPLSLTLSGDGPLSDWQATLAGDAARYGRADARLEASFRPPLRMTADADLKPGPAVAGAYRDAVGRQARLILRLKEDEDGLITLSQAVLTSAFAEITANGSLHRETKVVTGRFDAKIREPKLLSGLTTALSFTGLSATGSIAGSLDVPSISFDAVIDAPETELARAERAALTLTASRAQVEGPLMIKTAARITRPDLGDLLSREALGETVEVKLNAQVDGRQVTFESFIADMAAAGLSGAGVLDLDARAFSGKMSALAQSLAPLVPPDFPITDGRGTIDLEIKRASASGYFEGDIIATLETLAFRDPKMAEVIGPRAAFIGMLTRQPEGTLRLGDFTLSSAGVRARLDGAVRPRDGAFDLDMEAAISDAGPFTALAGLDLAGPATLTGGIQWEPENRLVLRQVEAALAGIEIEADGAMHMTGGSELAYAVGIRDLRPFSGFAGAPLSGSAAMAGTATGRLYSPDIDLQAALERLVVAGNTIGAVDATLAATDIVAAPKGMFRSAISGPHGPGKLSAEFGTGADGTVHLRNLAANFLGLSAKGSLILPGGQPPVAGKLALSARSLAAMGKFAGIPLSGGGSGEVKLSGRSGRQQAELVLGLQNLKAEISAPPLKFQTVKGRAIVDDVLGRPSLSARLDLAKGEAFDTPVREVVVKANGPLDKLALETQIRTGRFGTDTIDLAAAISPAGRGQSILLTRLLAVYKDRDFRLNTPFAIQLSGGSVAAENIDLFVAGGRLSGDLAYGRKRIMTDLALDDIPADLVNLIQPVGITAGRLTGAIELESRPGQGSGSLNLDLAGLRTSSLETTEPFHARLDSEWDGQSLDITARLDGALEDPFTIEAKIPLIAGKRSALPALDQNGPLEARVAWQGDLSRLSQTIPLGNHALRGDAVIDAQLSGTPARLEASGGIQVLNGAYENLFIGTVLTDLTLGLTTEDANRIDFYLNARDGGKGTLNGSGQIILSDGQGRLTPDLILTMNKAALLRRDDIFAVISGDLSVKRKGSNLLVSGIVKPDYAEIRLVNALPPSVVELEVIDVSRKRPAPFLASPAKNRATPVRLEIGIDLPKKIYVRGRGVESEWGGKIQVEGPASGPGITGEIGVIRGDIDLIGRRFDLEDSTVRFDGGDTPDPVLDIKARYEANGLRAVIAVAGAASRPEISFTSVPALPEDEILPRVLFGKSSASLSAGEALQIAQGIATLLDGGSGPLDRARASLGVDVLRLEDSGEDATAPTIAAGKYVSRNVYVGAKQNLNDNTSSAVVEIQILDNVVVDTEIGDQGQASAGIGWKYNY